MLQLNKVGLRIYVRGVAGQHKATIWLDACGPLVRVQSKTHTLGELLELKETTRTALRQRAGGFDVVTFNDALRLLPLAA